VAKKTNKTNKRSQYIIELTQSNIHEEFQGAVEKVSQFAYRKLAPEQRSSLLFFSLSLVYSGLVTVSDHQAEDGELIPTKELASLGDQVVGLLPAATDIRIVDMSAIMTALNMLQQLDAAQPENFFEVRFDLDDGIYSLRTTGLVESFNSPHEFLSRIVAEFYNR